MKFLLLALAACAPTFPPATYPLVCQPACEGCEAGCDGDPVCENKCYVWSSACCMNQGKRGIAWQCGCY